MSPVRVSASPSMRCPITNFLVQVDRTASRRGRVTEPARLGEERRVQVVKLRVERMKLERSRAQVACLVETTLVRDGTDIRNPDSRCIGVARRIRQCRDRHRFGSGIVSERVGTEDVVGCERRGYGRRMVIDWTRSPPRFRPVDSLEGVSSAPSRTMPRPCAIGSDWESARGSCGGAGERSSVFPPTRSARR